MNYELIKTPHLTEKSWRLKSEGNKVTFWVDVNANKPQIKRVIESAFDVEVEDVHTMAVKGKFKRFGRYTGYRADRKKAIITLAPNQKIEYFEGS